MPRPPVPLNVPLQNPDAPAFPDEVVHRFIASTLSFPQTLTAATIEVGDFVINEIAAGRYNWEHFERAELTETHYYALGAAMMGAHRANGINVWLGNQLRYHRQPKEVNLARLGALANGPRNRVEDVIVAYAQEISGDPDQYDRYTLPFDYPDVTRRQLARTFMFEQTVGGAVRPELCALGALFASASRALKPNNPLAVQLKNDIRRDFRIMARSRWDARYWFKKAPALGRLQAVPSKFKAIIREQIANDQPAIEEVLGRTLSEKVIQSFVGSAVTQISVG